jgi:hypothetical protein
MQVTFTNAGSEEVYVSQLYKSIPAGESVGPVSRTPGDINNDQQLKKLIAAGTITVAIASEAGDTVYAENLDADAYVPIPVHTNANRPAATAVSVGTLIHNTNDNAPNVSDGTNWRDMAGVVT